ncbi:LPS export ABC transporter permease LptF [Burkholderiaceae bacterium DAT-1]|nr:LPS export ABC transporter permease LptF [Burkholderiaceae bacterium DAT-1]
MHSALKFFGQICVPRKQIFTRSLLREFSSTAAASFIVLLTVIVVTGSVRILANAANGHVPADAVLALVGFELIAFMPRMVAVTCMVSVLWVLTRWWRDHEMAIWLSSGVSLTSLITPVIQFAVPLALVSGVLSIGLTPWAFQKRTEYQELMSRRDEVNNVAAGIFKESRNGDQDQVYYVENFSGEAGAGKNVFIKMAKEGRQIVVVAREGFLARETDGSRWAILRDGRRYEGAIGQADYRVIDFKQARVRLEEGERQAISAQTKATDSLTLWRSSDPEHQAELAWRIAIPVCTLMLALLSIPIAYVNPRVGRAYNLALAPVMFFIYNGLLDVGQNWLASGRWPMWIGMWPFHIAALTLTVILFFRRMRPEK